MFFINFNTPGGVAAGVFSSLFVIIVPFSYPPINDIVPIDDRERKKENDHHFFFETRSFLARRLIWQTLLVRVLALLTGVFSAFVVNMIISASAPLAIYRTTMFFAERIVWRTQKHRMVEFHFEVFSFLFNTQVVFSTGSARFALARHLSLYHLSDFAGTDCEK